MLGHQPSFKHYAYVVAANIATLIAVIIGTIAVVALAQGYRYDLTSGEVSLNGLLRVESQPVSATVVIDGQSTEEQTPFKRAVEEGAHEVVLRADGYRDWNKSVQVGGGKVEYLSYPRLIPQQIITEDVLARPANNKLQLHPRGQYALSAQANNLEITDLNVENVVSEIIPIPFLAPTAQLDAVYWVDGQPAALARYLQQDVVVWVLVDLETQQLRNVSKALEGFKVIGANSRTILAARGANDLWAIDIEDLAITPLTAQREQYAFGPTYIAWKDAQGKTVNIWDGEQTIAAYELETAHALNSLDILEYDSSVNLIFHTDAKGMSLVLNALQTQAFKQIRAANSYVSSSTSDRFALVTTADGYASYDFEKGRLTSFKLEETARDLRWADEHNLFVTENNEVKLMEFDGANKHTIFESVPAVTQLSSSDRYVYALDTNKTSNSTIMSRAHLVAERSQ